MNLWRNGSIACKRPLRTLRDMEGLFYLPLDHRLPHAAYACLLQRTICRALCCDDSLR